MKPNTYLRNKPGIYGIRNLVNNKIYVGKSKCMYYRCQQYIYDFKNRSIGHLNDYLHRSITKYGWANFEMFALEFCPIEQLAERELHWILHLSATDKRFGYNLRLDTSSGIIVHPETIEKIRKGVAQSWKDGKRSQHSEKMKANWLSTPERGVKQGAVMTATLTKYKYVVKHPDGIIEICNYQRLSELKLKSALCTFYKKNTNDIVLKGYGISRREITNVAV